MSTYRSEQLLENYGLIQFINHEFLPENITVSAWSDYDILAAILDQQINYEFQHQQFHTVVALLQVIRDLSRSAPQLNDLLTADISILYFVNFISGIQDEHKLVNDVLTEVKEIGPTLLHDDQAVTQKLQAIAQNFPVSDHQLADGFEKDMHRLLNPSTTNKMST
ncbi:hypothetical protein FHQ08_12255 [Lactobacillus sp. CC-MHH1034]|uniref:hypothetical protein n=1 Tax=Agrilactobacillus fermenti TaxID=2586909 RepID=UPI001E2CAF36|nr:hypothetical protein [Agrilactobacillus fermenti]MCD2257458.1 hypothetical protein [Agrilactobacillus fermenti]